MKLYEDLMEKFWDEIEDAEEYIELAHENMREHKEIATDILKDAEDECRHAENRLKNIIRLWDMKKAKGEVENEKHHDHYSHYCIEYPRLCTEIAELKLELELAKKQLANNMY